MGNTSSTSSSSESESTTAEKEFKNFYDVIDYIATYYIMTMDFKSLSKLAEKDYCNKLVILTSDIIQKEFNEREITYLEQRVKGGIQVNSLNTERFMFIDREKLEQMDVHNDTRSGIKKSTKKNRVCIGIAKFYIKIAHVFAAILMTINPVYTYRDETTGLPIKKGFLEKGTIPSKTERKVDNFNICDRRINALRDGEIIDDATKTAVLQPSVCDVNVNPDNSVKTLQEEPGIPELRNLYNDQYDEKTGTFSGMSPETLADYKADLKTFYTAFTGEEELPPDCVSFACIKLRDYGKTEANCQEPHAKFRSKVKVPTSDSLFVEYAKHLKKMVQTAADNQTKLLEVVNELFTYTVDPVTQKRNIRVNPSLTEKSLQETVKKTRKYIIDLYVKCETHYNEGVKIFQALVESKNAQIVPRQIETLSREADNIIQGVAAPIASPIASPIAAPIAAPIAVEKESPLDPSLSSLSSEMTVNSDPNPNPFSSSSIPTEKSSISNFEPINIPVNEPLLQKQDPQRQGGKNTKKNKIYTKKTRKIRQ